MSKDNKFDEDGVLSNGPIHPAKTYTMANNSPFYSAVPAPFKQYYERHVRQWFQWFDGYVNWFHNTAKTPHIFSTKIANVVCNKLSKQITGGRLLFDDDGQDLSQTQNYYNQELNALEFIEKYFKNNKLDAKLQTGEKYKLAGGDAVLKLNASKKELIPIVVRKDNYFFDTDVFGNMTAFSSLLYHQTKQVERAGGKHEDHYYVLEERKYADEKLAKSLGVREGRPLIRFSIKKGDAHGVSYKSTNFHSADYQFKDLTKGLRDELKAEFGNDVYFNEWRTMPIKDIGVYLLKASESVSFNPSLPFGESILSNILHILQSYDYYYTLKNLDMTIAKGRVLLGKHLSSPKDNVTGFGVLDKVEYDAIPYTNPEDLKPTPIQFELRSGDWKETRDNLLQEMAMEIGINPRSLATFIVPSSEKPSAHEISTDEDETALWIENQRDLDEPELNKMVETILDYYGYEQYCTVKFSKKGLSNRNTALNQLAIMTQNGMVDQYTKLEMAHPDKNEKQIKKMMENINKEKEPTPQEVQEESVEDNIENGFRNGENQIPKPDEE